MIFAFFIFVFEGLCCYLFREFVWFAENMDLISLIVIMINVIILSKILCKYAKNKNEIFILWLAFMARIIIMLFDVYAPEIRINVHSGLDSVTFHNEAVNVAISGTYAVGNLYSNVLGLIYSMFGKQIVIAEYFNILLSMWAILLLKDILYLLPIESKSRMIGFAVMALGPNYILLSPITLRESCIIFFITASLWAFIKWWGTKKTKYICISIAYSILGAMFHSGAIAMTLAYGIIIILYDQKRMRFTISLKTLAIGMIVLFCFATISIVMGDSIFGKFQRVNDIMDISHEADNFAIGGSAYLESQTTGSISEMVMNTPIRMFYFVFSPVPWTWRGFNDAFAFIFSTSIYLYATISMIKALRQKDCQNRNLIIVFLIMALFSALVFAWGVSNAGTALRHREKFISVYIVMLAVCLNDKINRKTKRCLA